jgi:hypothetical protein
MNKRRRCRGEIFSRLARATARYADAELIARRAMTSNSASVFMPLPQQGSCPGSATACLATFRPNVPCGTCVYPDTSRTTKRPKRPKRPKHSGSAKHSLLFRRNAPRAHRFRGGEKYPRQIVSVGQTTGARASSNGGVRSQYPFEAAALALEPLQALSQHTAQSSWRGLDP